MTDRSSPRDSDEEQDPTDQSTHQATFNPDMNLVSEELVKAVASAKDVDPIEVNRLVNYIDPDALDELFGPREDGTPRDTDGRVVFTYDEFTVHVHSEGTIAIYAPDE